MGWISTVFVHKALDAAVALECVDPDVRMVLFESVGIDPSAPVDPGTMISDGEFFGLLECIADLDDRGRSVPIHMGASMRCDDYGAFGLAFKSAPDLLSSYARVERYGKVVTSIANFRVERSGTSVFMEVFQGRDRRLGLKMTNELALAAAMSISREVSDDDFSPAAVHLMSDRPNDDGAYQEHFRCPILFGADRDALEVPTTVASRANRLSDDGMSKFFERHLDAQLGQINDTSELERRIVDQIGEALSEGVPTLAEIAGQLGMSTRTLQRRLSADGLAYQDLVLDARKTLSEQLLRRTDYALAEIAFLTGFSDQSTFTRAFKRWHGQTPASYRRGA
jgi:AraC-like DNA-binding protein